jgi:DNA repair exonuclease SbcCD nuclease subunit
MIIALLADSHFGARNDSPIVLKHAEDFYTNIFFPYLDKNNIDTIVHVGDLMDRRKYSNHNTVDAVSRFYWNEVSKRAIDHHLIIGNHDTYLKHTNSINSPMLLWGDHPGTTFYTNPEEVTFDGQKMLFLPWINDENNEDTSQMIANSDARFVLGHLELQGFEMHKGVVSETGLDKKIFGKFDKVLSGHFHKRSNQDNIYYLGTPNQMTWIDYGEVKGFHIFDTSSGNLTFIQNPSYLFHKVVYDDSLPLVTDFSPYENKYVKLIVRNKTDPYQFDKFVTSLNEVNPAQLVILEERQITVDEEKVAENIQVDDTPTILKKYVESIEDETIHKPELIGLLTQLYMEANELDVDS